MKIQKLLNSFNAIGILTAPVVVMISCSNKNENQKEKNPVWFKNGEIKGKKVVAQSFESIDFLSTFGLKPDYYVTRSDQGVYMDAMPNYLESFLNTQLSDVQKIDMKIRDWGNKQNFNPADMLKKTNDEKGVLMTYQSLHAADEEIKQAFDGVIYDDLGNDSGIGSYEGTIKLGDNYTQPRMYDVVKNYKAFTKGLDNLYGTEYKKQAENNSKKFSDYIQDFNIKNASALKDKTILFVRPNEKVTGQATANNIAIWTPLAYNLFYADKEHNGIGMKFPIPKDGSWPKSTQEGGYFDPWAINTRNDDKANVATKVVDQYEGKADYVVYLTNEAAWDNETPAARGFVENKNSNVGSLLKSNINNAEDRIIFADYSTFYRGLYGIVGQQIALQTIVDNSEWKAAMPNLKKGNSSNEILNSNTTLSKLSQLT